MGQELGLGPNLRKILPTIEAAFFTSAALNYVRMFVLMISRPNSNMDHVWSKTRSLSQIEGKSLQVAKGAVNPGVVSLYHSSTNILSDI